MANKFEVGKRYNDGFATFEIISRTAKTATIGFVKHAGKFNEKITDVKTKKINFWPTGEVIFFSPYEIQA